MNKIKTVATALFALLALAGVSAQADVQFEGQVRTNILSIDQGFVRIFDDINKNSPKLSTISNSNGDLIISNGISLIGLTQDSSVQFSGGTLKARFEHGSAIMAHSSSNTPAIYAYNDTDTGDFWKGTAIHGRSEHGVGIQGNSNTNYGLLGISENLDGVQGVSKSNSFAGVSGSGKKYGVKGSISVNPDGSAPFGTGVYGYSQRGPGIEGVSNSNVGIKGTTTSGVGVRGQSTFGHGVEGTTDETHGHRFDVYANGKGKDWGSSSSMRWKSNIEPISDPLDKLAQIRGVTFTWDEEHGGGRNDIGFIAEEVGAVFPEIVSYEENKIDAIAMDYTKIPALLVEAIKAMKEEYDAEIAALKSRIETLENN